MTLENSPSSESLEYPGEDPRARFPAEEVIAVGGESNYLNFARGVKRGKIIEENFIYEWRSAKKFELKKLPEVSLLMEKKNRGTSDRKSRQETALG